MENNRRDIVAVIDDDDGVRESLKRLLEITGYDVVAFDRPAAFLADRAVRPACLIVDHCMPGMTGLELAAHLRHEDDINTPLLLMTGAPSPQILSKATELGIDTVLTKPFDVEDLLRFVTEHV